MFGFLGVGDGCVGGVVGVGDDGYFVVVGVDGGVDDV